MATPTITFESLQRQLNNGEYHPVYLIHGKEGYYIDVLSKMFEKILPPDDRDFGLNILFAPQIEAAAVIDICRQMPMMTERQVVIVKEAQAVKGAWCDKLARYAQSPNPTTILVVCGRGDTISSKELIKAVSANGIVYEAQQVKEWQIPQLTESYIKSKGLTADPKALSMLSDFIGSDLSRLYNEIDKLSEILGKNAMVTPEAVERNIGVSKEYNNFELVDALAAKDFAKVMRIASYFEANPKQNPLVVTTSLIFGYFADLLMAYYAPERSDRGIKEELGLRNDYALRRIKTGMSNYNAFQIIDIIDAIRTFDSMSKGGGSRQNPYLLFKDLMYRILTTLGRK